MSNINYSTMAFLAGDKVRAISCVFTKYKSAKVDLRDYEDEDAETKYTYKTTDASIKVGDFVVVQNNAKDANWGMKIVKVTAVDVEVDLSNSTSYKWVVSKVDTDQFEANLAAEETLVSEVKKLEMKTKRKQLREALGIEGLETLSIAQFK